MIAREDVRTVHKLLAREWKYLEMAARLWKGREFYDWQVMKIEGVAKAR